MIEQGALTVAGQWRNFTAFPSILTIAVISCAAQLLSGSDVINPISMISSFMAGAEYEIKKTHHRSRLECGANDGELCGTDCQEPCKVDMRQRCYSFCSRSAVASVWFRAK
jgi:hypothetical protein